MALCCAMLSLSTSASIAAMWWSGWGQDTCKQTNTGGIRQLSVTSVSLTATVSHQSSQQRIGLAKNTRTDRNAYTLFGGCFILSEIIHTISGKMAINFYGNEFNDRRKYGWYTQIYWIAWTKCWQEIIGQNFSKNFEQPIFLCFTAQKFFKISKNFLSTAPVDN